MKKKSNAVRIGLIDMLTGFLVASIVLMLVIVYTRPVSGDLAGYPREFVRIEVRLRGHNRDVTKNAKMNFHVLTPDQKHYFNSISQSEMKRDDKNYLKVIDEKQNEVSGFTMWGPSYKATSSTSVDADAVIYTIYGMTAASGKLQLGILYYDNQLLSHLNYGDGKSITPDVGRTLSMPLVVSLNVSTLQNNLDSIAWRGSMLLGDYHVINVEL